MGIFSGILSKVAPIAGALLGGPIGGAIGGTVGKFISENGKEIGSAIGGVASAYSAYQGQEETNQLNLESQARQFDFGREMAGRQEDFQRQSVATQMEFQQNMANSVYQRGVADMEAAGLNPMLAYHQGGAPAPQGASSGGASASGGVAHPLESPTMAAITTAASLAKVSAEIEKIQADTSVSKSQALINAVQVPKLEQETRTSTASAFHLYQQVENMEFELRHLMPERFARMASEVYLNNVRSNLGIQELETERERTGLTSAERRHSEADLLRARNAERAQGSWWMREISPYLSDTTRAVASGLGLKRVMGR